MRVLVVVQRYGAEAAGGAEGAARAVATGLVGRGHEVEVVTSCATSYVDWANVHPPGAIQDQGVTVHRMEVAAPRDTRRFNALHDRVTAGPSALHVEQEWMHRQGPVLPELPGWILGQAPRFDAALFFTYLYWTTWAGLPSASSVLPTVLVPAAHDEPTLGLNLFRLTVQLAEGLAFLSPEEELLIRTRFRVSAPSVVTGMGVDLTPAEDGARSRGLPFGADPYLLYVGRLDPTKGTKELFDWFVAAKARRPGPLRLVYAGDPAHPLPDHPDVAVVGFVDERRRRDLMAGAVALVQPSYFESFSIVMGEAWAQARPVLGLAASPVVVGQIARSGGGLTYDGFAAFEAAVELLTEDPRLADALGAAGREYARREMGWSVVLDRFERLLHTVTRRRLRPPRQGSMIS